MCFSCRRAQFALVPRIRGSNQTNATRSRQKHEFAVCSLALAEIERCAPIFQRERAVDQHCEFTFCRKLCTATQCVPAQGRVFSKTAADAKFLCRGEVA